MISIISRFSIAFVDNLTKNIENNQGKLIKLNKFPIFFKKKTQNNEKNNEYFLQSNYRQITLKNPPETKNSRFQAGIPINWQIIGKYRFFPINCHLIAIPDRNRQFFVPGSIF